MRADLLTRLGLAGTDAEGYWQFHRERFAWTHARLLPAIKPGTQVLELAAGLMFTAVALADAGANVTVGELPATHEIWPQLKPGLQRAGVASIEYASLANPLELRDLPESSIDLLLFCEAIEHITFNPVALWREVYRVLKPGARIVVTTPSYYSLDGRLWSWRRLKAGMGGGIHVDEILQCQDTSPHWKEFSGNELRRYFSLLSSDFSEPLIEYADVYPAPPGWWRSAAKGIWPCLRQMIYCELTLNQKLTGIEPEPSWASVAPGYETIVNRALQLGIVDGAQVASFSGFCEPEAWGRWTNGGIARIVFAAPLPTRFVLTIKVAHVFGDNSRLPTRIVVADCTHEVVFARSDEVYRVAIDTDGTARSIELRVPAPTAPADADTNSTDRRKLGVGLARISVSR